MSVNQSTASISGFLFIDKPIGPTSHDIVDEVRRVLGGRRIGIKVGHAGTLDPLASGLLIIGVGPATKQLSRLVGLPKTYEVEITLGATSATDDAEGPIMINSKSEILNPKIVSHTLKKFIGGQTQVPPIYSAKKQNGQRLYKIARRGGTVAIQPHRIVIHDIKLIKYNYPTLRLTVHCASGTYIRSLARDIGSSLGTGGYVSQLRRTAVGPFGIDEATPFSDEKGDNQSMDWRLRPVAETLQQLEN
jgi:tRNA pseudouridine55 synthase